LVFLIFRFSVLSQWFTFQFYFCCLSFLHLAVTDSGMFLLPISKHFTVKLHKSLLDAETLKPALSRQ
jgi:hypothetical protein